MQDGTYWKDGGKAMIKECPFCGKPGRITMVTIDQYYAGCSNDYCKMHPIGWIRTTAEEAEEDWNRRYNDD